MTRSQLQKNLELSMTVRKGALYKHPEWGNRFHELANEIASDSTRRRGEGYAKECVQWMLDTKRVLNIDVTAAFEDNDKLFISVKLESGSGDTVTFSRYVEVADG